MQTEYGNEHSNHLLAQIRNAKDESYRMCSYPGSFVGTLVKLMEEKGFSNYSLTEASLLSLSTIKRLKRDEGQVTPLATVLAVCVGMRLNYTEAKMLLDKKGLGINSNTPDGCAYNAILASCGTVDIYEANKILEENGFKPLSCDN